MNTGVTKSDFIYFQNEILKDLKNLELVFNEKTEEMMKTIKINKASADSNFEKISQTFEEISEKIGFSEENSKFGEKLNTIQKKLEDLSINSRVKINGIEREMNNMAIKYDKIFINNLVVPGLIGSSCPFLTLANFIENANKKINELIIDKKKQGVDLKTYKDKLENLIGVFNNRVNNSEEKFKEYCNICFNKFDKNSNDRFNALEEKISSLRMENIKYSSELIERSNELKMDWDKVMNIKKEVDNKLNAELAKYSKYNNNLIKIFESQKTEFNLIKNRFTELSEFIKDIRFRNNINIMNNNNNNNNNNNKNSNNNSNIPPLSPFKKKVKFTQMSKRINFKLKQTLDDDSFKSNKELKKYTDNQEKKENSSPHSPAKTEYHFSDKESILSDLNTVEEKEIIVLEKTDKESEKEQLNNIDYIVNKPLELEKVGSTLKNYFNSNKGFKGNMSFNKNNKNSRNQADNLGNKNKKNNSVINKGSENEFSSEEKIKSIFNKKIEIKIAKIQKKENVKTQSEIEEQKNIIKAIPKLNQSTKEKKLVNNNFNKNIKIPEIKKNQKEKYKVSTFINSPKLKINLIETTPNINNNYLLSIKNKNERNDKNKIFKTMTKNNSPIKIDALHSDKSDFSNNYKQQKEKKENLIAQDKFSFLTNPNIKETSKINNINTPVNNNNLNYNININEENTNLDFSILNKKIIKTNNRLTELYMNSEIKMNKIYQYVKKVFDHFSGIFYFKELYNQKFNFDFSPKNLITKTDFTATLPVQRENKTKIFFKKTNKYFSPQNTKKQETYKKLVDKIEPYLIKKFKE